MTIWEQCQGEKHLKLIKGRLFRLVESQEQVATMGYVDTLEEQTLLEEMLESVKPSYTGKEWSGDSYHYLLKTPFRYPPLKHGSRFGRENEPSLFYGGLSAETTLAEAAYYRFVFWYAMQGEPIKPKINSEHSLFSIRYKTEQGIQLQHLPFDGFRAVLTHPKNYRACQELGTGMRQAGVEAFEYYSARDVQNGLCVALFAPKALAEKKPKNIDSWLCELSAKEVVFKQLGSKDLQVFPVEQFQMDGELPMPAA